MTKLKKIGLSALCGSLAATVAHAGAIDVTGGATATYSKNSGETTGNPIGMASAISFAGSGELDNGWTFNLGIDNTDQSAYSAASITLTTNSIGEFKLGQATGGLGIGGYDDKMPTAWEETWGTSLGTDINLQKGVGSSTSIQWALPTVAGTTLSIAYAPKNDGILVNDKSSSGPTSSATKGAGTDVMLNSVLLNDMVNIFGGYSYTEQSSPDDKAGTNDDRQQDHEEGTVGLILNIGPISAGAQLAGEYTGEQGTNSTSAVAGYKNTMFGVSFNVNDSLSVSYGELTSRKLFEQGETESIEMSVDSMQLAYSVGGASIKIAETDGTNLGYSTTTYNDREATTIALTLAF